MRKTLKPKTRQLLAVSKYRKNRGDSPSARKSVASFLKGERQRVGHKRARNASIARMKKDTR